MSALDEARALLEKALLGAALESADNVSVIADRVQVEDLNDPHHKTIYEVILDLYGRGEPCGHLAVVNALGKMGQLKRVGGPAELFRMAELAALPSQISYYVEQVKGRALGDRFVQVVTRGVQLGENKAIDPVEKIERVREELDHLIAGTSTGDMADAAEYVYDVLDELERGDDGDVIKTGFQDMDSLLSIRPGQVIIVGARPGAGKSTLGMDIARHVGIKLRERVYYASLEMSRKELMTRLISAESRVSSWAMLQHTKNKPTLGEDEWERIRRATQRITESKITIDDTAGATLTHIRARMKQLQRQGGLRVGIIDYIGLIKSTGRAENRQVAVAAISQGLKNLARELQIPLVVLCQLNRAVEGRESKRPTQADLRESGALEADADVVILIHREDLYDKESPRAGEVDLIVDKNRHGPQGTITVASQLHYSRFVDMAPGPSSPPVRGHLRPVS